MNNILPPAKKPRRKRVESPAVDIPTNCKSCLLFDEQLRTEDDREWGYCYRFPPTMHKREDAEGAVTMEPVVTTVYLDELPRGCGELKAKQ